MWEFHPEMLPKVYKRIAAISDRMWNKNSVLKLRMF